VLVFSACAADPSGPVADAVLAPAFNMEEILSGGICGGGSLAGQSAGVDHTCHPNNGAVNLYDTGPGAGAQAKAELDNAIEAWNTYLRQGIDLSGGMFWLARSSSGVPVSFDAGGGNLWCGTVTPGSGGTVGPVAIKHDNNCGEIRRAPRQNIVTHELSHVVGWNPGHGPGVAKIAPLTAGLCTTFLPSQSPLKDEDPVPGSVCYHEVEPIFRARMDGGWAPDDLLFAQPLLVGVVTNPGLISGLASGDTANLNVTHWRSMPGGGFVARSNTSVLWSSKNTSIAQVPTNGKVVGVAVGTTKVRLRGLQSSVPSGYQLWRPFRDVGDSVAVSVVAPPPISPHILLDEVPVYNEGWHTFTYVGNGSPGSLGWTIDDSRTTTINPDMTFTTSGWTTDVWISGGSYTLRVMAGNVIQDFPVCTYGSESLAGGGSKGPPTTEAVEGCPPPAGPPEYE
jgi:hypothetical protein